MSPHVLLDFELRDDIVDYLINVDSVHGPLVHAVRDNHHLVYTDGLPRLTRADVEQLWRNELILRPRDLTVVGFCEMCVCAEKVYV